MCFPLGLMSISGFSARSHLFEFFRGHVEICHNKAYATLTRQLFAMSIEKTSVEKIKRTCLIADSSFRIVAALRAVVTHFVDRVCSFAERLYISPQNRNRIDQVFADYNTDTNSSTLNPTSRMTDHLPLKQLCSRRSLL